jgi:hypothetical protein
LVGVPHFVEEASLVVEPAAGLLEQLVERAAAVVPGNGFVKVPPDPFDWIGLWRVARQEVQPQAMMPARQVILHGSATVESRVVTDHVNEPE